MSEDNIKSLYASLLESGDLFIMFLNMTGDWDTDKKRFTREHQENQNLLDDDLFFSSHDLYEED